MTVNALSGESLRLIADWKKNPLQRRKNPTSYCAVVNHRWIAFTGPSDSGLSRMLGNSLALLRRGSDSNITLLSARRRAWPHASSYSTTDVG